MRLSKSYQGLLLNLLILLVISSIADGASAADNLSIFGSSGDSADDKSRAYLGMVFGGNIGPLVLGSNLANPVLSNMFKHFNWIIVSLGTVIVSYVGVMGTINTAHEGEAMGKKWSSIWIPLKAVTGMLLMVPTPGSGYSLVQVVVMWVVLQGVGAANFIWNIVADQIQQGYNVSSRIQIEEPEPEKLDALTKNILMASTCMYTFNNFNPLPGVLLNDQGYPQPIHMITSRYTPETPQITISFGNEINPNICGQLVIKGSDATAVQMKLNAVRYLISQLQTMAQAASKGKLTPLAAISLAKTGYLSELAALANYMPKKTDLPNPPQDLKTALAESHNLSQAARTSAISDIQRIEVTRQLMERSKKEGWIHAGAYYFTMAKQLAKTNSETKELPTSQYIPLPTNLNAAETYLSEEPKKIMIAALSRSESFLKEYDINLDPVFAEISGSTDGSHKDFNTIIRKVLKYIRHPFLEFRNALTAANENPLLSLAYVGSNIMSAAENLWLMTIGSSVLSMFVTTTPISFLLLGFSIFFLVMWTLGATLAVYLPMIPYITFTVTALGWIAAVVEAMVAAPILALGLIIPGQDELGKTGHGLMMLAHLFLKPILMIFAFVLASRLLNTALPILNYAFFPAIDSIAEEGASPSRIFGQILPFVLYGGLVLFVAHKCFAVIYMLPNKVLRWIGGQGDDFGETEAIQTTRQAFDSGAGQASSVQQGAIKYALGSNISGGKKAEDLDQHLPSAAPAANQSGGSGVPPPAPPAPPAPPGPPGPPAAE